MAINGDDNDPTRAPADAKAGKLEKFQGTLYFVGTYLIRIYR